MEFNSAQYSILRLLKWRPPRRQKPQIVDNPPETATFLAHAAHVRIFTSLISFHNNWPWVTRLLPVCDHLAGDERAGCAAYIWFIACVLYRFYPKYSDTSTPYHICSKIWTSTIHYPMLCLKTAGWVANSVDPDETPRSAASHLGLYCLLRPVCPNTYGKYGMSLFVWSSFWYH